ncbi:MAG: phage portal protein [Polaribacter sp.]|uniref:phage portal protein n=1 Tax=Polaribacter sp. TaxID=1920175 RepID=UPI002F351426
MDLLELLKGNKIKEAIEALKGKGKTSTSGHAAEYENDRKQRNTQVGKRLDKTVGNDVVTVSKIPIPFQRKIVKSAASFLFGSPVKLTQKEKDENSKNESFESITNLWDDLRLDSLLLKFCKTVKSETEGTIIFFPVEKEGAEKVKIKARVLSNENGKVYPYLDAFGDMIAFGWEYPTKENDKDVLYMYLWTAETNYVFRKEKDWEPADVNPKTPNLFQKIPVVYLSQNHPEWWEVQDMIDTFEMSFSKFVDTNGYFASPMYKVKGAVGSMPKKDDTGKMVKLDIVETDKGNVVEADLEVLSWDRAPEALKLEFETAKGLIHEMTDTPDLSFDNVKGLGTVSGLALKLMFLGPILKAKWSEGDYQIVVSRIINLLKSAITNITKDGKGNMDELRINTTFTSILPENLKETIEVLSEALGGKPLISQKTAVSHNPLVENVDEEMTEIEAELSKESASELGGTEQI